MDPKLPGRLGIVRLEVPSILPPHDRHLPVKTQPDHPPRWWPIDPGKPTEVRQTDQPPHRWGTDPLQGKAMGGRQPGPRLPEPMLTDLKWGRHMAGKDRQDRLPRGEPVVPLPVHRLAFKSADLRQAGLALTVVP